jgi:hypothetical protein
LKFFRKKFFLFINALVEFLFVRQELSLHPK